MTQPAKVSRKEQILDTLLVQLSEQPEKITTKSLATQLGMTESALYRHFASKKQIFSALIARVDSHLTRGVEVTMRQGENYIDMMHDVASLYLRLINRSSGYARIMLTVHLEREDTQLVTDMLAILDKYEGAFRHIMRDMERNTAVRVATKHIDASAFIMCCLHGIALRSLHASYKTNPEQQFATYWAQLTETLFGTE